MVEEQKCWYVINSAGKVEAVSISPINVDDVESRNGMVVESDLLERELFLLKLVNEDGQLIYKNKIIFEFRRIDDNNIEATIKSDTYTGQVQFTIHGMIVTKSIGDVFNINHGGISFIIEPIENNEYFIEIIEV